ncbi:hypothetical protein WA158_008302 [Blastocystis sp. Blastoise]
MNSIKRYFTTVEDKNDIKKIKVASDEIKSNQKDSTAIISPSSVLDTIDSETSSNKNEKDVQIINVSTPTESVSSDQVKTKLIKSNSMSKSKSGSTKKKSKKSKKVIPSDSEEDDENEYIPDEDEEEEIEYSEEDEEDNVIHIDNDVNKEDENEDDEVDDEFRSWAREHSKEVDTNNKSTIDILIQKAVCVVQEIQKQQEEVEDSKKTQFKQPASMKAGKLFPYQLEGINWMRKLFENCSHGLLADEMGLGKTIQVIGLYAYLRENGIWGPVLIIAPLSTLGNWMKEFKKWSPEVNVQLFYGTKEEREEKKKQIKRIFKEKDIMKRPVIITSYDVCRIEEQFLQRLTWFYIVVDEGHRLKNHNSALMKCLFTFAHNPNTSRLILTGTPLQNNLKELWSLLNFLLPDVFVSPQQFITWFDFSQSKTEDYRQNLINTFRQVLSPFFLRRTKQEIEVHLPEKRECIIYTQMAPSQQQIYDMIFDQGDAYRQLLQSEGCRLVSRSMNNPMMRLRQCVSHPFIIYEDNDAQGDVITNENLIKSSGKLLVLDHLLKQLYKDKHRVLIFTQFKEMISIFEDYLNFRNYSYCVLDGSVSQEQRQTDIDAYAVDESLFCYILTTRAGGQGINLSAADTCIIYDSDWNPQMDIQAMDRCHRLGQTRPVAVYRLVTVNSIDLHMQKICEDKKILEKIITHKNKKSQGLERLTYAEYKQLIKENTIANHDIQPISMKSLDVLARAHASGSIDTIGEGWEVVNSVHSDFMNDLVTSK